ncbi:MAG: DNA mismatch repair endonuclease MutL [Methanohalobium sp.]|uniref:DNA mismatch repair endonuclease MutL n=1 Tax=Methanohalobium sp. TaxID=2837493 RepID=UPI00397AA824
MDNSKIHVLDENTISKIAAGEVIERPASVVKELIENSIDAGATEIKVDVKGGGAEKIVVTDNGTGMSHDDAYLAFTKHATSKIWKLEDLYSTTTLGFRGEALSAIASVSKVEMTTRQKGDLAGTKVVVQPDGIHDISETGASTGTCVEVYDLFYNTPARRKYLKSERTELAHISDIVSKQALGDTSISFTLTSNGRTVLHTPLSGDLFDNIIYVYGRDVAKSMIPVDHEFELVKVSGYISKPVFTRSGTDFQSFFINNRSVSSRAISNALRTGYYTLISRNRYPAAVLNIKINPNEVDINVHPRKSHVRLSHEQDILDAISESVESALKNAELTPRISRKDKNISKETSVQLGIGEIGNQNQQLVDNIIHEGPANYDNTFKKHQKSVSSASSIKNTEKRLKHSERLATSIPDQQSGNHEDFINKSGTQTETIDIKALGQIDNLYIVAEIESGLVLIDQHAAHERIMYEHICKSKDPECQELISPITLELSVKEKVLMEEYIPYLEEFGFAISEFGPSTYIITSVPTLFGKMESPDIIHDLMSEILSAGRIKNDIGIYDHMCKTMACRSAIKAGHVCSTNQIEKLVAQLRNTQNPYTCPHGRPTMLSFTRDELDRMFKRTEKNG